MKVALIIISVVFIIFVMFVILRILAIIYDYHDQKRTATDKYCTNMVDSDYMMQLIDLRDSGVVDRGNIGIMPDVLVIKVESDSSFTYVFPRKFTDYIELKRYMKEREHRIKHDRLNNIMLSLLETPQDAKSEYYDRVAEDATENIARWIEADSRDRSPMQVVDSITDIIEILNQDIPERRYFLVSRLLELQEQIKRK